MKSIALPLVMIASLSTLVSCGTTNNGTSSNLSTPSSPVVTGVVVTPTIQTGAVNRIPANSMNTDSPIYPTKITPPTQTPAAQTQNSPTPIQGTPDTITRRETVSYNNPSGSDRVEFAVTVTDGIITSASATPKADNEISLKRQTAFAAEVSAKVVGKKASDLNVDAIGGSSLTTGAFETFVHSF